MDPTDFRWKPDAGDTPALMRRFTDDEMAALIRLARDGRTGPSRALDALWDLILTEVDGVTMADITAAGKVWQVEGYAIADDQHRQLADAIGLRRRLSPRAALHVAVEWLTWAPAAYGDDPTEPAEADPPAHAVQLSA
jgi:hypothetical protein